MEYYTIVVLAKVQTNYGTSKMTKKIIKLNYKLLKYMFEENISDYKEYHRASNIESKKYQHYISDDTSNSIRRHELADPSIIVTLSVLSEKKSGVYFE
eukprot:snap_masked-scaffold_3-processed-gene-10.12-mRNA-1 protein AED:1.00 eAED:1.00 QI:0/0/0/0/1/1/2/0/97